jgi:hypothetical protein
MCTVPVLMLGVGDRRRLATCRQWDRMVLKNTNPRRHQCVAQTATGWICATPGVLVLQLRGFIWGACSADRESVFGRNCPDWRMEAAVRVFHPVLIGVAIVMRFISSASVQSSGVSLTFVLIKHLFQLISYYYLCKCKPRDNGTELHMP